MAPKRARGGWPKGRATRPPQRRARPLATRSSVLPPPLACGRAARCRFGDGRGESAHHALAETRWSDAERQVEAPSQVLQGDRMGQLHDLGVVEVLFEPVEQL